MQSLLIIILAAVMFVDWEVYSAHLEAAEALKLLREITEMLRESNKYLDETSSKLTDVRESIEGLNP